MTASIFRIDFISDTHGAPNFPDVYTHLKGLRNFSRSDFLISF